MISFITEPHTRDDKITGMPRGTKSIYCRHTDRNGAPRAGIITSAGVMISAMESWCNRDCAVALTKIGGVQTILISLYLDITKAVQPKWLDDLMTMIEKKKLPLIMGIDSNAHSSMYGPSTNARGDAFEDFVLQYGLKVENVGTTPTFEVRRGNKMIQTHIDVTLTRGLTQKVEQWTVDQSYNASDLSLIHI